VLLLDEGHRPTAVGQLVAERVAGLAGTDHDGIESGHGWTSFQDWVSGDSAFET
jgi:hypothetical protein